MNQRLRDLLWGVIVGMIFVGLVQEVRAEAIASMPNQAGGKIVLTDELCTYKNKTYDKLRKAYYYTDSGITMDGCFVLEDEAVTVIYHDGKKMRYPVENFTLIKKSVKGYGT